jgi:hypothetical protein
MDTPIDGYSDRYGKLTVPTDPVERFKMARSLLGYSLVTSLDYWLDFAVDKLENPQPETPYARENEYAKKDRSLREPFASFDKKSKEAVLKLLSASVTGLLFSILTDFD